MQAALFFDIDGTILSEITNEIPDSALDALARARENGHLLFINTGRTYPSIPGAIRQFPFDGYLCGCGSYLVFHDEVLLESHLSEERGRQIIEKMYECRLDGIMEGSEDIYFPVRQSRFDALESTRRHFTAQGLGVERYIGRDRFIYDKMFVYADGQSDTEAFFTFLSEDMEVMPRDKTTFEVIQKKFSKATACDFMLKKLGMTLEQAYVFGDSSNDTAMFRYAQNTIAMGRHAAELEPYTQFMTKKVEEDGIMYALEHYGLI